MIRPAQRGKYSPQKISDQLKRLPVLVRNFVEKQSSEARPRESESVLWMLVELNVEKVEERDDEVPNMKYGYFLPVN